MCSKFSILVKLCQADLKLLTEADIVNLNPQFLVSEDALSSYVVCTDINQPYITSSIEIILGAIASPADYDSFGDTPKISL